MKKLVFLSVVLSFGLILTGLAFAGGGKEQPAPSAGSTAAPATAQPTAAAQTATAGTEVPAAIKN